jgi:hypothetical protein
MEDDMHTMTDRLGDFGGKLRERRTNSRIDHLDEENQRLRTELRSMRSTLDRERSDREEILDALKGKPKTVVKKKRGGLVRMAVIGGGAYVLGSRAGRERYEQIVTWARQMKDRGREATEDFKGDVVGSGSGMAPITPGTTVSATTIKPTTKQDSDKGSGSTKSGAGNS